MRYSISSKITMMVAAVVFAGSVSAQQTVDDGVKMYNYKKFKTAEKILEPLAATDARANYYLGLVYLEEGNTAKASAAFGKFPEDPANISGTARVAFISKDAGKGMQIAKDLAAKSKKKEWIQEKYAADAITYTQGGDYHQAVTWYKDALTKADMAETHIAAGDAYRRIPGGGGDAMTNYETVTEKDPKNSLALSRIGDLWYEAHNYQSALDNYGRAKDTDPGNPLPYKALAEAFARSNKFKQALENIQQYIKLSDNTVADKMEYLRDMFLAQSYCDAATYGQQIISGSDPLSQEQKTEATGITGYSMAHCGDSVKALQILHTYFQIENPKNIKPGAYIELGKLYMKLGMYDSAGYFYNKGIEGDTAQNKTDIYRTIAEAFKGRKDYCKSAQWYDNLIKANPETQPLDYFWRGCMYYYCKDFPTSVKAFEAFETKYPDQPSAYYWHARALAAIDSEATEGTAVPSFTKWLEKVGPNYDKKNDMKIAFEYLLLYYYNKKDKENLKIYMDKIRAVDPQDSLLKQIEEAEKAPGGGKKPGSKGKK